eukprot:1266485-Amphidinium_carterae.2
MMNPALKVVTVQEMVRECCWARNTHLIVSGYTPVELATGRRPPGLIDVELLTPEQLTSPLLKRDCPSPPFVAGSYGYRTKPESSTMDIGL